MIKLLVTALLVTFVAGLPQQRRCPVYRCMACPDGYDLDENGCESCACKEVKRAVCSPVLYRPRFHYVIRYQTIVFITSTVCCFPTLLRFRATSNNEDGLCSPCSGYTRSDQSCSGRLCTGMPSQ
ncbi:unnamed protein product [Lymnaea stagnalis]|uniref:Antistasin-like domain-containing protein n=1 Tax=Lymnaea stagnalis TaxID=6523 RepID=A0AAV2ILH0_LYMST